MENIENILDNFIDLPEDEKEKEFNKKVKEDKKKYIKSDFAIIERIDRQIITEDGRMLLRERY